LFFTPEEEEKGNNVLSNLGIGKDTSYICFYSRDSAYLDTVAPNTYWDYHDYRDSDIKSYLPAVEDMASRGYFMLRMGQIVKELINAKNSKIIDYSVKSRTDFADIFLCSKCHFFIGDTGGFVLVPSVFRRPVAFVNFLPLMICPYLNGTPHNLFIPKKLFTRKENRLMTINEILSSGAGNFMETKSYDKAGIDIVNNTPEEIKDLVIEIDDRLKGRWKTTKEDEYLQERFWRPFKLNGNRGKTLPRIGAKFLRQNCNLLD